MSRRRTSCAATTLPRGRSGRRREKKRSRLLVDRRGAQGLARGVQVNPQHSTRISPTFFALLAALARGPAGAWAHRSWRTRGVERHGFAEPLTMKGEAWEHVDAASEDESSGRPPYVCVILIRSTDAGPPALFVEQRPNDSRPAAGQLCCFGGKRKPGEEPLAAILRECEEELGWTPPDVVRAIDLHVNGKLVAFFFMAAAPHPATPLRFEPGVQGIWITSPTDPRLSPWHSAVLQAWSAGQQHVAIVDKENA